MNDDRYGHGMGHGMPCPNNHRNRRSIRLKGYDYTQPGAYFITICTQDRACLFGDVVDGEMRLNEAGKIAEQCWLAIPDHFAGAELDVFVVMPNHIHGIVVLVGATHVSPNVGARHASPNVGARHAVPLQTAPQKTEQFGKPVSSSIPTIIRSYKSAVTKRINEYRRTPRLPLWQRNYYEHIIRNDESLHRIREYIANNPLQWALDRENPDFVGARHLWARHAVPQHDNEPWRI